MVSLIVGLGNPGDQYIKTRHNAGFLFVDELIKSSSGSFSYQSKFQAECVKVQLGASVVHLIKPQTYMNKSGDSVRSYADYYRIEPQNTLLVHDELDLEPGVIRLKKAGGHGGHNGLRDIFTKTSSRDFLRLRLGIGRPGDSKKVADYVLKSMNKSTQEQLYEGIYKGLSQIDSICQGEVAKAMQILHTQD